MNYELKDCFLADCWPFLILIIAAGGAYVWFLVNAEKGRLIGSGSDDLLEAAKENAETALGIHED